MVLCKLVLLDCNYGGFYFIISHRILFTGGRGLLQSELREYMMRFE